MAKVNPRLIDLVVDGTNRADEVSRAIITSAVADNGFRRLGARTAERTYTLSMTLAQDHVSGSLWQLIWTGAGTVVTGIYAPHGNTVPSMSQPLYEFIAVVAEPEGDFLGGAATTSARAVATIEVEWPLATKPVEVRS